MDGVALGTLLGLSLTVFIVPILWFRGHDNFGSSRYLALFVLVIGISLLQTLLLHSGMTQKFPWLSGLGQFFYFALGPLLYFYTKSLTNQQFVFSDADCWHFLPVAISFLCYLPVYVQSPEAKRYIVELYFNNTTTLAMEGLARTDQLALLPLSSKIYLAQFIALMLHLAAYAMVILRRLKQHRSRIELEFSSLELISLNWLRWLNWLVLTVSVSSLLFLVLRILAEDPASPATRLLPVLSLAVLVYYSGWMGLRQPQIYGAEPTEEGLNETPETDVDEVPAKAQTTGLSTADAEEHWRRLQQFIGNQKPYLRSGLTIKQLADELELSVAHLSQVINSFARMNFFDYINLHRIEYSKELLAPSEGSNRKVLDIALSSGFNSQSTFYAQFKKHVGCTPSQYRARLRSSN